MNLLRMIVQCSIHYLNTLWDLIYWKIEPMDGKFSTTYTKLVFGSEQNRCIDLWTMNERWNFCQSIRCQCMRRAASDLLRRLLKRKKNVANHCVFIYAVSNALHQNVTSHLVICQLFSTWLYIMRQITSCKTDRGPWFLSFSKHMPKSIVFFNMVSQTHTDIRTEPLVQLLRIWKLIEVLGYMTILKWNTSYTLALPVQHKFSFNFGFKKNGFLGRFWFLIFFIKIFCYTFSELGDFWDYCFWIII